MAEEPFLLVSLEEEKAKKLAQVLSNDTARRMLDHLSKVQHATESEVAKALGLPLSTVHYNMGLLAEAQLVDGSQYSYSPKGKEMVHYSLASKYVIIAPRNAAGLKEKLRQFLPVVLLSGLAAAALKVVPPLLSPPEPQLLMARQADGLLASSAEAMPLAAKGAGIEMAQAAAGQEFAIYFLAGSLFALVVYFVWAEVILKRMQKK